MSEVSGNLKMPALTLAVVTHDSSAWLPEFFGSWRAALAEAGAEGVAVCVADSGSSDGTVALARSLAPEASIIECVNIGYGAAANRAINRSNDEWILLCNPDVTFPREFFAALAGLLARPAGNVGAYAPRLRNADGSVQASVGRFPSVMGVVVDQFRRRELRKYTARQPEEAREIDWAMGACLVLHRERVRSVGRFDERFFLYVEEVDLLRRMKKQGYSTVFVPELSVGHLAPNASLPARKDVQRYAARGLLRYFAKHGGWMSLRAYGALAAVSGRLALGEAFAGRKNILRRATGP